MRLEKYLTTNLTEGLTLNQIKKHEEFEKLSHDTQRSEFIDTWNKVRKECKPFLRLLTTGNKNKELLYRGLKYGVGDVGVNTPRKDRKPLDTKAVMHKFFDELLEELYGWKARSEGVFASGSKSNAGSYGTTYIIFPVGKIEYLWSKGVSDSYSGVSVTSLSSTFYNHNKSYIENLYQEIYGEGKKGIWVLGGVFHDPVVSNPTEGMNKEEAIAHYVKNFLSLDMMTFTKRPENAKDIEKYVRYNISWAAHTTSNGLSHKLVDAILRGEDTDLVSKKQLADVKKKLFDLAEKNVIDKIDYQDTNFVEGLESGNEFIIKTDKYYYFNTVYEELIQEALWG